MRTKPRISTRVMVSMAMLTAVATVLMFLDFPMPIFPSFLKFDFSDLPAIIGAFAYGPVAGIIIELMKNLIHLLQTSTGGIGELANFLVGVALVVPAGIIYRAGGKSRAHALIGMAVGIVTMAIVAGFANYFILIPFFAKFMPIEAIIDMCATLIPAVDSLFKVILFSIVPFNLFKGIIISLLTYVTYKRLSRVLHDRGAREKTEKKA